MKSKILFFTVGPVPTDVERSEAAKIVGNVVFRNAKFAGGDSIEQCDGVAGLVPDNYRHLAGEIDAEPVDIVQPVKRGRKPATKPEAEPAQTPLIPAEDDWKPNA